MILPQENVIKTLHGVHSVGAINIIIYVHHYVLVLLLGIHLVIVLLIFVQLIAQKVFSLIVILVRENAYLSVLVLMTNLVLIWLYMIVLVIMIQIDVLNIVWIHHIMLIGRHIDVKQDVLVMCMLMVQYLLLHMLTFRIKDVLLLWHVLIYLINFMVIIEHVLVQLHVSLMQV